MVATAAIIGLLTVVVAGLWLGRALVAVHRAQAAADLAALTAAIQLPAGLAEACREAQSVATTMNSSLRGCDIDRLDVVVTVTTRFGGRIDQEVRASARAGPVDRQP